MNSLYKHDTTYNSNCKIKGSGLKYTVRFDSPFKTGIAENDLVYGEVFLNEHGHNGNHFKESKNPNIILLLHGFASRPGRLGNYYSFIKDMNSSGFAVAFMHQPYHLMRTPENEKSGHRLIYFNDIQTLDFYNQAVLDARKFIDILQKDFNFSQISLCGFSLGSMVSTIIAAIDKRIARTVLVMGGGNWYRIHWQSMLSFVLKGNCVDGGKVSRKKCKNFYKDFPEFKKAFIKNVDLSKKNTGDFEKLIQFKEKPAKACFLCDPLIFAPLLDPRKVLMINSRLDHYFPRKSVLELWESIGRPKIYWLNRFHSSKVLSIPKITGLIKDYISYGPENI